jgi:hypothetical protein
MSSNKTVRRVALLCVLAAGSQGCAVFRPMAFWRDTLIKGNISLVDEKGAPMAGAKAEGVTVNFINLSGSLEESVVSVASDPMGRYRSPKVLAGSYKVEALLPGYVIETQSVKVKNHEQKNTPIVLKKIREAKGKSLRESDDDNIPNPGDVQIAPPGF